MAEKVFGFRTTKDLAAVVEPVQPVRITTLMEQTTAETVETVPYLLFPAHP